MASMIKSDNHHPYIKQIGKQNQGLWECSDKNVNKLLNICSERAVDQESLGKKLIKEYSDRSYIDG